jgi:hypothetical protein
MIINIKLYKIKKFLINLLYSYYSSLASISSAYYSSKAASFSILGNSWWIKS